MSSKKFSLLERIYSFKYAIDGIQIFFKTCHNGRIQLFFTFITLGLGFFLKISSTEWVILLICIGMVISAEILNTAIEVLCNHLHPEVHPKIKIVKDLSAGAVLFVAICSFIVGMVIFLPKLLTLVIG